MAYIGIIFMAILFLGMIAGGAYYLSKRFSQFFPVLSLKGWLLIFIITTTATVSGSWFSADSPGVIGDILFYPGTVWAAVLLYLLSSLVIVDLVHLVFKMSPGIRGAVVLTMTALIVSYGFINTSLIRVKEVTIPIAGLTEEITAVHITDMHLGSFWGRNRLEKTVEKITEINPDVVFNTGDFFESKEYFTEDSGIPELLGKIQALHYFVHGNHESYVGVEDAVKQMKDAGVIVLRNETTMFGELQIVGLDNMREDEKEVSGHTPAGPDTVKSVLEQLPIDGNRPTVVLHHRPSGVSYMNGKKADLLLSGHTHGGQLFPMALIQEFSMPYNKGLFQYENMDIYVSQGTGSLFPYVRVGTNSEITKIKLVPESGS